LATSAEELKLQCEEINESFKACCPGWLSYDDALGLEANNINIPCKENTATKRFRGLDVESTLKEAITIIETAASFSHMGNLRDALIYWRIAFHISNIILEAPLRISEVML